MPYSFDADGTLIEDADGLYNQYGMQIYTQVMGVSAKLACPEVEHPNGHKLFMEGAECDECAPGTGTVYNPTTQKCECPEGTVWDDAYNTCVVSGEVEEKEEEVTEEQEEIYNESGFIVDVSDYTSSVTQDFQDAIDMDEELLEDEEQITLTTPSIDDYVSDATVNMYYAQDGKGIDTTTGDIDLAYEDIIKDTENIIPDPVDHVNTMGDLNVTFTKPKRQIPTNIDTPYYIPAQDVLSEKTKLTNENLYKFFSSFEENPEEARTAATFLAAMAGALTGKGKQRNFNQSSLKMDDFDVNNKNSKINKSMKKKSIDLEDLPPQIKSLIQNFVGSKTDFLSDPKTAAKIFFKYLTVYRAEVLNSYNVKNPKWQKLTPAQLEKIKKNGGSLIVRWKKYNLNDIIPDADVNTETRIFNEYFIIKNKQKGVLKKVLLTKGPGCGCTAFGNRVLKQLQDKSESGTAPRGDTTGREGQNGGGGLSGDGGMTGGIPAGATVNYRV